MGTFYNLGIHLGPPSHLLMAFAFASFVTANQNQLFVLKTVRCSPHSISMDKNSSQQQLEALHLPAGYMRLVSSPLVATRLNAMRFKRTELNSTELSESLGLWLHLWLHLLFNFVGCCCCCCCCCTPFSIFKWSQFLMSWQATQRIQMRKRLRIQILVSNGALKPKVKHSQVSQAVKKRRKASLNCTPKIKYPFRFKL